MPPKPQLTHFLCIPLVNHASRPQLQASISRFKAEVTNADDAGRSPIQSKAIRPVGAMHFTIGVMSLLTPERLEAACTFLKHLNIAGLLKEASDKDAKDVKDRTAGDVHEMNSQSVADLKPLKMTLSGLHPMQSASRTSSLYIGYNDTSPALTPFCLNLQSAFRDAGFLLPDTRPLKLHATIVNTIYVREAKSGKKRWSKDSAKIDATQIIETYKDYEWAKDLHIDRVAICEMGAKKILEGEEVVDQVYTEVASVSLP
ncbi:hypothetical protein ACLMJK_005582 [Lecanora helva]